MKLRNFRAADLVAGSFPGVLVMTMGNQVILKIEPWELKREKEKSPEKLQSP